MLRLVYQKSHHHHHRQHHRQIFLAVAVIVFEVISLVFHGIECLVFNPPAGTPATHDFFDYVGCQCKFGDLAKILDNSDPFHFFNRPSRQDLLDPSRRPRDAWNPAVARGTLAVSGE
ncbi:MAG: hypothetical protein DWH82_04155 [Planctomycetota bacterium]|nr:MAG: hypothetical protein DWH82_04155 [Planctomycetota bacterium]